VTRLIVIIKRLPKLAVGLMRQNRLKNLENRLNKYIIKKMNSEKHFSLRENHRRSLTSTLIIVEQLLIEIEDLMTSRYKTCCFEIKNDVDTEIKNQNLIVIEDARKQICILAEKYGTEMHIQSLQRIIDVKKTKIWEILCDSKARKLKGFGEFPKKLVKEYDNDIDKLILTANKIKY
jgi:hypothetical protein